MIRFTEPRELQDGSRVEKGEERDFGPEENAAFVNNQVAEFVTTGANGGRRPKEEDSTNV
jgi:hypothetical protein